MRKKKIMSVLSAAAAMEQRNEKPRTNKSGQ
jgi:hypothetical protein